MPRFHLGTWLTRTIVTPNGSLVVFGHGNTIWSAQINLFFATFCHCTWFTLFFEGFFCFLLCFLNRQSFLTNQLTEHSSRQSGDYLPGLILVVNILLWSNTVFIITRHGLHDKQRHIYIGVVISSNSVGLQNSASRLAKPTSRSTMAGIMYLKNLIIYLKFCFGCFDLYIQTSYSAWRYNRSGIWRISYFRKCFGKFITTGRTSYARRHINIKGIS